MSDVLIDTNVLVYAVDSSSPIKQHRAIEVLENLVKDGIGFLSTQCLSEYFSVVTRKLFPPVSLEQAHLNLVYFCRIWPVKPLTGEIVLEAVQATIRYRMSFWDAQIWASAKHNGALEILSEDFSDGHVLEGVRFRNPFADIQHEK